VSLQPGTADLRLHRRARRFAANQQIVQAQEKHDTGVLESLDREAANLAQKIGPEYVKLMDGLDQANEDSSDDIAAALMSLDKLCGKQ
jgi:hypothetical protein